MRVQASYAETVSIAQLQVAFEATAANYGMSWRLVGANERPRVLIMLSKFDHCVNELLYRWNAGQLNIDIPALVSNHEDLQSLGDTHDIPFIHIPVTKDTRDTAEEKLLQVIEQHDVDLVVLARYMQILSPEVCDKLAGRAMNIHHSFLPGFKGQRPYFRAFDRGVKLVGATAHYVTADLDEGPIIEQEVVRVNHSYSVEDLTVAGRDAERLALAWAVQWHAENRVILNGTKTVVFQ